MTDHTGTDDARPQGGDMTEETFAEFWAAYPRKTAKAVARRRFDRIKPDRGLLDQMLAALDWQRATDQWSRGFIPHPATWLNQRRWEDEPWEELTDRDLDAARRYRARVGWWDDECRHDPVCSDQAQCLRATALRLKHNGGQR